MKLAIIGQKGIPSRAGGVEIHVEEIASRLACYGENVTVYCRESYCEEKYDKYKNGNKEKITLIASLLLSKDNDEKKEIIESLFSGKIKDIFSHYFL